MLTAQANNGLLSREQAGKIIAAMPPGPQRDKAARLALQIYGPAPNVSRFFPYRFEPEKYIREVLNWTPWAGMSADKPGQVEILRAYQLALLQFHEKRDLEAGKIEEKDLKYYRPEHPIQNWIRMEAGHTTGKTKIAEGIICHFFDCFMPSVAMMYAPTWNALKRNLWQELKADRKTNNLPGRILETIEVYRGDKDFIMGNAVSNSRGAGTEKIQGTHPEYGIYVVDEAEGIDDFLYDSIDSMTSGGTAAIVLLMANPRTRTSRFHKIKEKSNVVSFQMSCINHPNVVAGREIVPNAVQREYVRSMIEQHCSVVDEHNPDNYTFTLEFPVMVYGKEMPAGTIFEPDHEFMWRVLGIAPANISEDTVIPVGRYDEARKRETVEYDQTDVQRATFGVDIARWGLDFGTLYIRWKNVIWRAKQFYSQDSKEYFHQIYEAAQALAAQGVTKLHIRIDAGGGAGLIDTCNHSMELRELFVNDKSNGDLSIFEVHFGSQASDPKKYDNLVTEMYFETCETLKGVRIHKAPVTLEDDLTLRKWEPVNRSGRELKRLQDKKAFKKIVKRSHDDGDGFVLAAAPDKCFPRVVTAAPLSIGKSSKWTV
jgi:hypothetical protein